MANMRSSLGFLGADLLGVVEDANTKGIAFGKTTGQHTKPPGYVINQQQEYASTTQQSIYDDTGRAYMSLHVKNLLATAKKVIARENDKALGITSKTRKKARDGMASTFKSTGMNVLQGKNFGTTGMSSAMRTGASNFTQNIEESALSPEEQAREARRIGPFCFEVDPMIDTEVLAEVVVRDDLNELDNILPSAEETGLSSKFLGRPKKKR